ncbi:TIGR01244 family sulfur transferase [Altericroceibacterium endophyticum]|uniref:TIGR01244 family phosphatase n=1 Tax=Altericroceibacterium endophyticum TaxID=1808508 RepID=A0A6I4T682_9SPHN|nr:TIGR01244 family sulfur transferase [Altericroceibacterium endophyticum]MXO65513.1 TIGR01244 family phosphatase [Altericroceibacterium endophyticum]
MADFRKITDTMYASPQISLDDVATAKEAGFAMIINNRPDGEADDQVESAAIEQAARAAGMDYTAIPITHSGFSEAQVNAMIAALGEAQGPVLAYCRSGTRSTLLWSLAQALMGKDPEEVASKAAGAGYDVSPIRPNMDMFAARGQAI